MPLNNVLGLCTCSQRTREYECRSVSLLFVQGRRGTKLYTWLRHNTDTRYWALKCVQGSVIFHPLSSASYLLRKSPSLTWSKSVFKSLQNLSHREVSGTYLFDSPQNTLVTIRVRMIWSTIFQPKKSKKTKNAKKLLQIRQRLKSKKISLKLRMRRKKKNLKKKLWMMKSPKKLLQI